MLLFPTLSYDSQRRHPINPSWYKNFVITQHKFTRVTSQLTLSGVGHSPPNFDPEIQSRWPQNRTWPRLEVGGGTREAESASGFSLLGVCGLPSLPCSLAPSVPRLKMVMRGFVSTSSFSLPLSLSPSSLAPSVRYTLILLGFFFGGGHFLDDFLTRERGAWIIKLS